MKIYGNGRILPKIQLIMKQTVLHKCELLTLSHDNYLINYLKVGKKIHAITMKIVRQ